MGRLAEAINSMVARLAERITEHVRMEDGLRQARLVTARVLEMAKAAQWSMDPAKPDQYTATSQLCKLMGEDPAHAGEHPLHQRLAGVEAVDSDAAMRAAADFHAVFTEEATACDLTYPLQRSDGRTMWVRDRIEAVRDAAGQIISYAGIIQDITEYIQQQRMLEAARKAQSGFLANMSHEIRTPLNAVIGMGYLLRRTELTPLQADYLNKVDSSAQLLLALINDILDLSKIEAGEIHMECITFALADVVQRVMDVTGSQLTAKHLRFVVNMNASTPSMLVGDPLRLQQVLTNLVTNACKFTERGEVGLHVRLDDGELHSGPDVPWPAYLPKGHDAVRLCFTISDTGVGMTEEQCRKIFRPFVQADASTTRKFGGSGLGLTICKSLVDLMAGSIRVRSTPGDGSCFDVLAVFGRAATAIPVQEEMDANHEDALALSVHPGVILLAEDNDINRLIAGEMLAAMGHRVDMAHNGREAVDMVRKSNYDIVFMDIQMPEMDGITATRHIRALACAEELPIIAMTANAMDSDREHSMQAGMNDHITKPIDPDVLRLVVERWIAHTHARRDGDLAQTQG